LPTVDSDRRPRWRPTASAPTLTVAAAALAAVVFLASQARRLYFFGDDWAFLLHRQLSWQDLMRPHNEHWSALPVIAFRTMVRIFGIDHYLAYAMMPILLHVLCSSLLYLLMRRSGVPGWPAAIMVVSFLFVCGNAGENPLWDFQIGFLGSAALGLLTLNLHVKPQRLSLVLGWGTTVLSLMCSGMALPMLGWLGIYLLVRHGIARALLAAVPPALVYLAWYAEWGRNATPQATTPTPEQVLEFAWSGIGHVWSGIVQLPAGGSITFLALIAVVLLAPLQEAQRALALSGLLNTVATFLLLGISRGGLGPEASHASRYVYFGIIFTLPAAALGLSQLSGRLRHRNERVVTSVLLVCLLVGTGMAQAVAFTDTRAELSDPVRPRVLASVELIDQHQRFLSELPLLPYHPDISVSALARTDVRRQLPKASVPPRELLNASVVLQVASSPTSLGLPPATELGQHGITGSVDEAGCAVLHAGANAWIDLPPTPDGSQVQLTSNATAYPVQLLSGRLISDPVQLVAVAGAATFVATTAQDGTLRVTIRPGRLKVCLEAGD
jgi:hypothetical protein